MNDTQRQQLIGRIQRLSGTVGSEIPDEITIQGTTVDLNEFVLECRRLDAVPQEEQERIEEMKRRLERERLERKQRIDDGDISYSEGERLVESIHGIDRALNALEGLDTPDIDEQLRQKKLEGARQLLELAGVSR